ncbi:MULTISPECIES: GNAT family N-acetyltransferase [unclassified Pseudomonas]|uniref:GNAT family N-acetyltransferase n=1 Tax=unclassified Pseudomonas TaxID=196821 RepID=UPI0025FA302A|nr:MULTISPECIES: GNAT family N-acetyltransferase [unclassified Pseudomonas]
MWLATILHPLRSTHDARHARTSTSMTETPHIPTLAFRPVDLDAHYDVCQRFRIDALMCTFGSAELFYQSDGGPEGYVIWLRERAAKLPGCLVHVWRDEEIIGQIEMDRLKSDISIGYVNLFYLVSEQRGQGLGALLEAYAWRFLSGLGCQSLRLSAAPNNRPAWVFYKNNGWQDLGPREPGRGTHTLHKEAGEYASGSPRVINPDDYLETEFGREFTPERDRQAWELAYACLNEALSKARRGTHVYLVMGVQGAGKSRWVAENLGRLGHRAVVFDAALPARRHRERLLAIARRHGMPVIALFLKAPLGLALLRNARRSADKRVPEQALKNVYGLIEPPTQEEGFIWVQTIEQPADLPKTLETPRLNLIAPDVGLAHKLADALNGSYELHRDFLIWSKPHWTLEETQESLDRACADFSTPAGEKRYFLIGREGDQPLVGCIGATPEAEPNQGFEIGYWVNEAYANRGLVKEALLALVAALSGQTLRLTASSANIASQKLAEAAGFEPVQTLVDARVSGRHGVCDTVVYQREAR